MDTTPLKNAAAQCATCKNHIPYTITCKAFPNGIPWEIMIGEFDHSLPHPQDNGIRYEVKEGREPYYPPKALNRKTK
jgi:hypothetical protein